jgi:hypothetical protein
MRTTIVAMWDHNAMVHVGEQPCPAMKDGGAGISFAELFYLAMNKPEKICKYCVAKNKRDHDEFLVIMSAARSA